MNIHIGVPQQQLEAELAELRRQYVERTTPQALSAGDFSSTDFVDAAGDILERIRSILEALNLLDPDKYPLAQIRRRNRTRLVVPNCA